jgi:A/G-specific adenine glycosylase
MLEPSDSLVKSSSDANLTGRLLDWYDHAGRELPWRLKGRLQDAYRVWLSEIMLQQTTVEAVRPYYARFLLRWPDIHALAEAPDTEVLAAWAGLGYYARARNLLACARHVSQALGGRFPQSEQELRALPGIGAYTAAAIAAIAFDEPAIVIDGNIERVITRLRAIDTPLPAAKKEVHSALSGLISTRRPGDFAQALMDLGATICTPRKPSCLLCPLAHGCKALRKGNPERFPVKAAKKAKKQLSTLAFLAVDPDDRILVGTRLGKGLLGGMSEVPNTEWKTQISGLEAAPFAANWQRLNAPILHIFTHIELQVDLAVARLKDRIDPPAGWRWVAIDRLHDEPIPALFRKVIQRGLSALETAAR